MTLVAYVLLFTALWWLPAIILLFDSRLSEKQVWRWVATLAFTSWIGLAIYLLWSRRGPGAQRQAALHRG